MIYTDNQNTVDIFSSLSAQPAYNILLTEAIDLLTSAEHDLCVFHVPGERNQVADALSRGEFDRFVKLWPQLHTCISQFHPYCRVREGTVQGAVYMLQPPQIMLGASKK
jgi:hypothetical protein